MRCKKHTNDQTSNVGVCASCLCERLFPILAVQSHDQSPPSRFPRSVSPPSVKKPADPNRLFFSTPQLVPTTKKDKVSNSTFSLFRSRLKQAAATSSSPPSWLSNLFSGKKMIARGRKHVTVRGRGLSPARVSECGADVSGQGGGEADVAGRGGGDGDMAGRRFYGVQNVAGFVFCISPLVRVRPKRRGNLKSKIPEVVVKPRMEAAASFCKNRSRKVADFGRLRRRQ